MEDIKVGDFVFYRDLNCYVTCAFKIIRELGFCSYNEFGLDEKFRYFINDSNDIFEEYNCIKINGDFKESISYFKDMVKLTDSWMSDNQELYLNGIKIENVKFIDDFIYSKIDESVSYENIKYEFVRYEKRIENNGKPIWPFSPFCGYGHIHLMKYKNSIRINGVQVKRYLDLENVKSKIREEFLISKKENEDV